MAAFPEIHPEKCPYCGKELGLVTAKYEWNCYYKCKGCGEKYPTKNGNIPDMQAVRNSPEYKTRTGTAGPSIHTPPAPAPSPTPSPVPTPVSVAAHNGIGFTPYTVKTFCDTRIDGQSITAGTQLQEYLNSNRIPRVRIVSISSSVYPVTYGANMLVITLVYC